MNLEESLAASPFLHRSTIENAKFNENSGSRLKRKKKGIDSVKLIFPVDRFRPTRYWWWRQSELSYLIKADEGTHQFLGNHYIFFLS